MLGLYLVYYSVGRVWIEAIRIDPSEIVLGLRINIWSAIVGIAIGIAIIAIQSRRHPGQEPSVYRPGREPSVPAQEPKSEPISPQDGKAPEGQTNPDDKLVSDK
jgi:prolipoprotein diacylglyceryltransferase